MEKERSFYERLKEKGVSRRDFMKYCTALTATMGLSAAYVPKVAEVFAAPAGALVAGAVGAAFGDTAK